MKKVAVAGGVLVLASCAVWWLIAWRGSSKRDATVQDIREQVAVIDSEVQGLDFDWNSSACEPKDGALYADLLRRKGDAALAISRARDLLGDDPRSAGLDQALGRIDDQLAVKKNRCLQARLNTAGALR
jgi:hypothetical protein